MFFFNNILVRNSTILGNTHIKVDRKMVNSNNKVMSLRKAISDNVKDGDELVLGNYTLSMCVALASEVIRQKKKHLTVYTQSSHIDLEYLAAADCIDKLITNFISVIGGTGNVIRRMQRGDIEVEEYSNFHYNARLQAGMYGFSFMPVLEGTIDTDLFRKRTFMGENKFKIIKWDKERFRGSCFGIRPLIRKLFSVEHIIVLEKL